MSLDVAALWEAESSGLRRFLQYKLGAQRDDADDLLSEIFARVCAKRHLYRDVPNGAPRKWLYQVACNKLTDYWRRWKPHYSLDAVSGAFYAVRFDDIETRVAVADALDALTDEQRAVIVGRFYEGYGVNEFGCFTSREGAKKLSVRAYAQMRKRLERAA